MRSLDESSKRWAALFAAITSISDLKSAVKRANGDGPCITGLRSVCWKSFLLFANFDTPTWSKTLEDSRTAYSALREHFLRNLEHPGELESSVDPLTDDETSPWNTLRQDEALRAEIFQDVERCMPENLYFRQPSTQIMLLDVLFVFCKLNGDVSYRQGMHELLAPILWVVERDAIAPESVDESRHTAESEELLKEILDARFVEHDSFTLFSLVMQTAKSFYELDRPRQPQPVASSASSATGTSSPKGSSPIVERSKHIHENYLARVDPGLADRLRELDVLPQVFLIRWIRLLFGREFPFDELLALWDSLFAEDPALGLVDLICVSMLLRVRWQLMEADYSTALTLLLRYPSPGQPHGPSTFVDDALFLRDNLTIAGGIEIISKYSGKSPAPLQPESGSSTPRHKPGHPKKSSISSESQQEKPSARTRSPLSSPARYIQQQGGLEALLQDAARGFYDRGEKWGVNKAVRDAVDEVKRNVQGLQQSAVAAPARRAAQASPRWSLEEGRSVQVAEAAKTLTAEVQRLSERNKTLANMLSDAMDSLWAQQKVMAKESSPEAESMMEAFNLAIARIQLVKLFLEDSDLPLTEMQQQRLQERTAKTPQSKTNKSSTTTMVIPAPQSQSTHMSTPSSFRSPSRSSSPSANATATPEEPPPPPPATPSSITAPAEPRPKPTTSSLHHSRSSLAQSSFAWMLGGDINNGNKQSPRRDAAASFAEFSSPGSLAHRTSSNVAKKGFLFGGGDGGDSGGDEGDAGDGAVSGRGKRKGEVVRVVGEEERREEGFSLESLGRGRKSGGDNLE